MIYSSADILRVLGSSEIIRLTARIQIVDGGPNLTGEDGLFIYVSRFPSRLDEFEATWKLWVIDYGSEPVDLVVAEIARLLPKVGARDTALGWELETTELRSASTQTASEPPTAKNEQVDLSRLEERFQSLLEDVQDQMLLVHSGVPGRDGRDGVDGRDGRDGKDMVATDVSLEDLQNVEEGIDKQKGQVLTWDGGKWTNLFIPQVFSAGGAGGGEGTVGPAGPQGEPGPPGETGPKGDPGFSEADGGDFGLLPNPDAGDFTAGTSTSTLSYPVDGGNFSDGSTVAYGDVVFDGGHVT